MKKNNEREVRLGNKKSVLFYMVKTLVRAIFSKHLFFFLFITDFKFLTF